MTCEFPGVQHNDRQNKFERFAPQEDSRAHVFRKVFKPEEIQVAFGNFLRCLTRMLRYRILVPGSYDLGKDYIPSNNPVSRFFLTRCQSNARPFIAM